jgi:hypothetical protein
MSSPLKRKQPSGSPEPASKRRKTNRGEVAIMTANVCGLDAKKWANLEKMALAHDIDIIAMQEGANKKQVNSIVGNDWEPIVTQESAFCTKVGAEKVIPMLGQKRFNVVLKRKSATDIDLQERSICTTVENSQKFKDEYIGKTVAEPGKRIRKPKIDSSKLNQLGMRSPQLVELNVSGCVPASLYNFHAPQGSGSAVGYSGMEARIGHDVLAMVIEEDNTPYKAVIGDQNAHPQSMRKHYPSSQFDILSATTSATELVHAAIPLGLHAQPIDLGQDGIDFNNKGQPGCSDHPPQAFIITLPTT